MYLSAFFCTEFPDAHVLHGGLNFILSHGAVRVLADFFLMLTYWIRGKNPSTFGPEMARRDPFAGPSFGGTCLFRANMAHIKTFEANIWPWFPGKSLENGTS